MSLSASSSLSLLVYIKCKLTIYFRSNKPTKYVFEYFSRVLCTPRCEYDNACRVTTRVPSDLVPAVVGVTSRFSRRLVGTRSGTESLLSSYATDRVTIKINRRRCAPNVRRTDVRTSFTRPTRPVNSANVQPLWELVRFRVDRWFMVCSRPL